MNFQKLADCVFKTATLLNHINKAVLKLKLCPLEALGELLAGCLLNNTLTCKSYKRIRLSYDNITLHCKACGNAAGCGVGYNGYIKKPRIAVTLYSTADLRHLPGFPQRRC